LHFIKQKIPSRYGGNVTLANFISSTAAVHPSTRPLEPPRFGLANSYVIMGLMTLDRRTRRAAPLRRQSTPDISAGPAA
jgi:hypothetical protein